MLWERRIAPCLIGLLLVLFGLVLMNAGRQVIRARTLDVDLTPSFEWSLGAGNGTVSGTPGPAAGGQRVQWQLHGGDAVVAGVDRIAGGVCMGVWGVVLLVGGLVGPWRSVRTAKIIFVVISATLLVCVLTMWPVWWIGSDVPTTAFYGYLAACTLGVGLLVRLGSRRLVAPAILGFFAVPFLVGFAWIHVLVGMAFVLLLGPLLALHAGILWCLFSPGERVEKFKQSITRMTERWRGEDLQKSLASWRRTGKPRQSWYVASNRGTAIALVTALALAVVLVVMDFRVHGGTRWVIPGIVAEFAVVLGFGSRLIHGYWVTISEPDRNITIDGLWLRRFITTHRAFAFKELENLRWSPNSDAGSTMAVSFRQGESVVTYGFPGSQKLFSALEAVQAMNAGGDAGTAD